MDLSAIAAHFDDVAKIIGAILVVGGAAWSIWKFVFPMLKSISRSFVQMEKIANIADAVLAEFRPNGGNSMKDSITRIETGMVDLRNESMRQAARQWAIVASLPDPVFEAAPDGKYTRVNTAFLQLTQRTPQEVLGNGWEIVIHPDDRKRIWDEWQTAVSRLRSFDAHFKIIDADSVVYTVRATASPYNNPKDEAVLGYLGRITEIRELAKTT